MMGNDLRKWAGQKAIDDERLWVSQFRGDWFELDNDEIKEIAEEQVERVEQSANCVGRVFVSDVGRVGPTDPTSVVVAFVVARSADAEMMDGIFERADYFIRSEITERERQ